MAVQRSLRGERGFAQERFGFGDFANAEEQNAQIGRGFGVPRIEFESAREGGSASGSCTTAQSFQSSLDSAAVMASRKSWEASSRRRSVTTFAAARRVSEVDAAA
jgi:hypothetical protein